MITTADWLRYIDSLGPSDANSMRMRLQSAGAEPQRAEWLVKLVWKRQVARAVARIALAVIAVGIAWLGWQWWRAFNGDPSGPTIIDMIFPAGVCFVGAMALVIASAVEIQPEIDLVSHRTIPSDLAPPPRQVAVTSARVGAVVRLVIGIMAILIVGTSFTAPEMRKRVLLRDHGVETTGHVTGTYTTKGSKGGTRYHIRYAFDRGSGSRSVSRSQFQQAREGDAVTVTYLPDQPDVNAANSKAELGRSRFEEPIWIVLPVYVGILFFVILLLGRYGASRQRSIAETGVATVAQITKVGPQSVNYQFGENSGRWFWGKTKLRERPAVGQPLVVLYDPDKPKRSLPIGAMNDIEFG